MRRETVAGTSFTKTMVKNRFVNVGEQGGDRRERRDTGRWRDWGAGGKGGAKRTGEGKRKADEKEDNSK